MRQLPLSYYRLDGQFYSRERRIFPGPPIDENTDMLIGYR